MEFNNDQLNIVFPFHVLVDESLNVLNFGTGLKKISPSIEKNKQLSAFLELRAPAIDFAFGEIVQKENRLFLFSAKEKELQLKGQAIHFKNTLLFILSPVITDSSVIKQFGISLKDFAIYDGMVDSLFLLNAQKMALTESKQYQSRLLDSNQQLEKVNREIAEINESLEQKVAERTKEIQDTLTELKAAQAQLIQSEKMASLGELTAGIAHEIQNPLNFVNNFSDINKELLDEMNADIEKGNYEDAKTLAKDITENEDKISHHGRRADEIVKAMLLHSRISSSHKEPTDINALCAEYLRLAYHGYRAKDNSFNAEIKTDFDENVGKLDVVPQDIGRVVLNLINNAFYAVTTKASHFARVSSDKSSASDLDYKPVVEISTQKQNGKIEIRVKDNGLGIPESIKEKIFQPFFTTKPTGQGTGLGLSLSYDIVKAHGGEIKVDSVPGQGCELTIMLPNR